MIRHPAPARPAAAVAPCPSDADLAGWLAGSFPPGAADHLTDCPGCRSRADAMADADPVLGRAREALDRTPVTAPGGWAGLVRPTAPAVPPDIPGLDGAEFVGRGGMGVVYRAWQARLGRPVAVKVMSPWLLADPDHRARFAHEAAALGRLNHPNVVAVYDHGGAAGQPYLVLEWVPGSLAGRLRAGPLPPRAAVGLVRDAARGVAAAHAAGIVHRDLKPANVLLSGDPAAPVPKLADFGLAKLAGADALTVSGMTVGTPAYMAPEQTGLAAGEVGPAADVYALGVILYESLTGRPPFAGGTAAEALARAAVAAPPALPADRTLPGLEAVYRRCLEKDPARRPPSAGHLADDLDRVLAAGPRTATRRRPGRAMVAAGVVLVGVAAAAWAGWPRSPDTPPTDPADPPPADPPPASAAEPPTPEPPTPEPPADATDLDLIRSAQSLAEAGRHLAAADHFRWAAERATSQNNLRICQILRANHLLTAGRPNDAPVLLAAAAGPDCEARLLLGAAQGYARLCTHPMVPADRRGEYGAEAVRLLDRAAASGDLTPAEVLTDTDRNEHYRSLAGRPDYDALVARLRAAGGPKP